jgi:hypothetical protein
MLPELSYIIVAGNSVKASEAKCVDCGKPFDIKNASQADLTEIALSGICDNCYQKAMHGIQAKSFSNKHWSDK